jgi:hypothetical protein
MQVAPEFRCPLFTHHHTAHTNIISPSSLSPPPTVAIAFAILRASFTRPARGGIVCLLPRACLPCLPGVIPRNCNFSRILRAFDLVCVRLPLYHPTFHHCAHMSATSRGAVAKSSTLPAHLLYPNELKAGAARRRRRPELEHWSHQAKALCPCDRRAGWQTQQLSLHSTRRNYKCPS